MKFLDRVESASPQEVRSILKERFGKNQVFFKKKDKKLYGYLVQKPTQFGLVADERGVNILSIATNTLVYPMDEEGRHMAIRSSKEMAANPMSHTKWMDGCEVNPFYMASSNLPITAPICKSIFGYAHLNGLNPTKINFQKGHLPFAALYGLGGGFALEAMLERYEYLDSLFIYEPFADFFAISAYFVDYEELYVRVEHLMLCVEDAPSSLEIRAFFGSNRFGSLYPRLELTMYDAPQMQMVKNAVRVEAGSLARGFGSYEDEMIGWRNSQKNCSYSSLNFPVLVKPRKKISFPICVVGNGGSLDESIEFLRQNRKKMVIFSAGTALRTLLKNGIKPDFQIEIERTDYLGDILAEAGAEEVDMIAANVVDPKTLAASKAEKFIFFRDYTASSYLDAPKFLLEDASPFVGNAAFSLAANLSKKVLLCGMDVGYKRGRTIHSKDSIYKEDTKLPEGSVRVRANFDESEIYSNALFGLSRSVLEFVAAKHGDVKAKNLSDGAYIAGIEPCREFEFGTDTDKKRAIAAIKSAFSQKKEEVFARDGLRTIEREIADFRGELFAIFGADIVEKRKFFDIIRVFEGFLAHKESKKEVSCYLFGGSLRHIVFCMYVSVLHTDTADFKTFFDGMRRIFFDGFDSMLLEFRKELAKGRVSGLLGGLKAPVS